MWSLVHLFTGGIIGLICIHKKWPFYPSLIISTILIILWEYFEFLFGIHESITNISVDIILGVAGFIGGYKIPGKMKVDPYMILIPLVIAVSVLAYIGWLNYLTR